MNSSLSLHPMTIGNRNEIPGLVFRRFGMLSFHEIMTIHRIHHSITAKPEFPETMD